MRRLTAPLALLGVVLVGVAFWLYDQAADDKRISESICRLGGDCSVSMSWAPTAIVGVAAALAFFAAWRIGRSVVDERTEQLVD